MFLARLLKEIILCEAKFRAPPTAESTLCGVFLLYDIVSDSEFINNMDQMRTLQESIREGIRRYPTPPTAQPEKCPKVLSRNRSVCCTFRLDNDGFRVVRDTIAFDRHFDMTISRNFPCCKLYYSTYKNTVFVSFEWFSFCRENYGGCARETRALL